MPAPLVVGIGGSNREGSSTDLLLRRTLQLASERGARIEVFGGTYLATLPIFDGGPGDAAAAMVSAVREADGVVLASPGYHGGLSGLVKNGLDHLEALRAEPRPYLDGRPVATIVSAAGWQACGTALVSLRSTVHALRGWPTPFGVAVNSAEPVRGPDGGLVHQVDGACRIAADQVMDFIRWRVASTDTT